MGLLNGGWHQQSMFDISICTAWYTNPLSLSSDRQQQQPFRTGVVVPAFGTLLLPSRPPRQPPPPPQAASTPTPAASEPSKGLRKRTFAAIDAEEEELDREEERIRARRRQLREERRQLYQG